MKQQARISALCTLVVLMGCAGSGEPPKTYSVRGKVVRVNGAPLTSATITFHAKDYPGNDAMALIQKDGSFTLGTFAKEDGAVPGRYVVTVEPLGKNASLPKKYQSEEMSPWSAQVNEETNNLQPFRVQ